MAVDLSHILVVGISSSALFDTSKAHKIFLASGVEAYVLFQIENENKPLAPGNAFPLIQSLLRLNPPADSKKRYTEVVILSQAEPEAGIRIMNSVDAHKLDITRAVFTGGQPVSQYLHAYNVMLFLSKNESDVGDAASKGVAAGLLYDAPDLVETYHDQLRIAFDGDAVLFSEEAEEIYQREGIDAFFLHEKANAEKPLPDGPFAPFLRLLANLQKELPLVQSVSPIRTALVTARNSPAHKRAILTFRAWGIKINEMFFMGGVSKDQILKTFRPHIFFDDQDVHLKSASKHVPSARVPTKKQKPKTDSAQVVDLFRREDA